MGETIVNIPAFYRLLTIFRPYIQSLFNINYYSVVDLQNRVGIDGEKIYIDSYYAKGLYPTSQRGGWRLVFKSSQAKSGHNGVTVHSPTVSWNGTQAGLAAYQAKTGETDLSGTGCWVLECDTITVEMAGVIADCTGHGTGTDNTDAIKKALGTNRNVYLSEPEPGYMYKVKDRILLNNSQSFTGAGVTKSKLYVDDDYNMSAVSVVSFALNSVGCTFDKIGIEFYQDTTNAVRANLIDYPWGLRIEGVPLFYIGEIRVTKGTKGVYIKSNTAGGHIKRIENGCLSQGVFIDNSFNFIHVDSIEHWPFDYDGTNLYSSVYSDGNTVALECLKCDGLAIDKLSMFRAKVKFGAYTGLGAIPKTIGVLQLDGDHSVIESNYDFVQIDQLYTTKTVAQVAPSITVTTGKTTIGQYHCKGTRANASIDVLVDGGELKITSGHSANSNVACQGFKVTAGTLDIDDVNLAFPVSARSVPYIEQTGGVLKVTNCDTPSGGSGLGNVLTIATDNASHKIQNNNFADWGVTLPSGAYLGVYGSNRTNPIVYNPTVSFETVGDFVPTYSVNGGRMWHEDGGVRFEQRLNFNTNAYTTAAGDFLISGPPITFKGLDVVGGIVLQFYSKIDLSAGNTYLGVIKVTATNNFKLTQSGDNIARTQIGIANIPPSATNIEIVIAGFIPTK